MASAVFSQEAQSGTVSALASAQLAAVTISASVTPLLIFGQERLIEDITISLHDASRLMFRR
jgi:hypothetical protein